MTWTYFWVISAQTYSLGKNRCVSSPPPTCLDDYEHCCISQRFRLLKVLIIAWWVSAKMFSNCSIVYSLELETKIFKENKNKLTSFTQWSILLQNMANISFSQVELDFSISFLQFQSLSISLAELPRCSCGLITKHLQTQIKFTRN